MPEKFILAGAVATVFTVPQRGLVVVPAGDLTARVSAGARIQLRTGDGRMIETCVKSIEMVKRKNLPSAPALLLPSDFGPEAVPEGSEIWVLAE